MITMLAPADEAVTVTAPSRLNCAGFCGWCGEHGCQSPICITGWSTSWWTVCPHCGGIGCPICFVGVVQVDPGPGVVQAR
jgi:hypothetical protein